jgi:citrate lyase synthetase
LLLFFRDNCLNVPHFQNIYQLSLIRSSLICVARDHGLDGRGVAARFWQMLEKKWEYNMTARQLFVWLKKAYDAKLCGVQNTGQ